MGALDGELTRPETRAPAEIDRVESVDARMLALMRCLLAFSALIIIYIDPSEPARLVELTYFSLSLYCIYSVALAFISFVGGWPPPARFIHWVDVIFYSYLVALTEGTNSIFFHFFFFSILVASFLYGYREGLLVTAVSAVSFLTVGVLSAPAGTEFELNRALIRPVYLATLGYMIAHWGGYEDVLKRRLLLLKEVNNVWSPRFGVHHVIGINLNRLLGLYEEGSAILVVKRQGDLEPYRMYSAAPHKEDQAMVPREVTEETAHLLLKWPASLAARFRGPMGASWLRRYHCEGYDLETRAPAPITADECEPLANLLETRSFVTIPYSQREGTAGRFYLTSEKKAFEQSDIEFLIQFAGALAAVVENMQLMDDLVARAAEHERFKIARDLHDTTIQPYIGLKLALDALHREAGPEGPLSRRIGEIAEMAGITIHDMRNYASSLKEATSMAAAYLASAIQEQAARYRRFYGIDVDVKCHMNAGLTDRLAAATFQIVSEGLSNILRHTTAKRAYVAVLCEVDFLLLQIGNERAGAAPGEFTPRSIFERVEALGGTPFVEQTADGYTVVRVSIPM